MAKKLQQVVFLYLCGLIWACRGNPSASCLRDLTASATSSCCSPQPFIELSFFIRLNSAGSCNSPDYLGKGVRLEIKPRSIKDWQPIRFYAPTRLTNESTIGNVTTVINDTHVTVDDDGFSSDFRLYTNDSQSPIHVTEYICGQKYTNSARFRWVQQYLGTAEEDEDTWSIDNITIRYWDGSCYTLAFEEDFENSTAVNMSGFVIQRGVIEEPPCGPTASGQALYFNRRAASSGTRFRRRRGNTPTINFASTSRECNLPQPLLRTNQECSVESDRCAADLVFPVCSLGSFECRCEEGYRRDGVSCIDIDECASQDTHNCSQICSNNNGGFECQCGPGYELAEDGIACNDINECASKETHNCSQVCNNTDGNFVCQCIPGYELADDGVSCNQHNATIGFEQTLYVVMESTGSVRLNISILAGGLSRAANVTLTVSNGSVPFDYTDPGELVLQFGATNNSYSILILIVADGILENNETFLVELTSDTPEVTLNPFSSEVVIVDDSNVTVGLEQTNYSVVEGESVEVCVVLVEGTLERNVFITLSSNATAPGDYTESSIEFLLSAAAQMSCVNISTVDDSVIEHTETLVVTLASAEPSVAIFPQQGMVEILDNDDVTVGLQQLSYVVSEDGQKLNICAILSGQNEKAVTISVNTADGSAIAPDDYSTVQNVLTFVSGVTVSCTGIRIIDDSSLEDNEIFSVVLITADSDVLLHPASANITIVDNDARALEEQISNGNISSNEAATILKDLLMSILERGEPLSSNFSEAFVGSAGSVLDSSNIQENSLTVSDTTAVASSVLDTLDTFALAIDGELQLETESISLEVMEVKADDEQAVRGIRREGSEIVIPPEVIRNTEASQVRVASFYFRNLSGVLPNSVPNSNGTRLVSPVISSTLGCSPEPCRPINTTTQPIMVVLTHQAYQVDTDEPLCVFWDFMGDGNNLTGIWSTNGCSVNKSMSSTTATVCECNHLTHFAILLSPKAVISDKDAYALQIIGYVGVSISLVCLLMTVVAFLFLRSLRGSMRNYIHINLCISLMVAQLTFIVGVDKTANEKACQAVAVLLHYFFLVSFMWMLMEGLVLYVALVRVFVKHQKQYMAGFTIFSYGAPALYMGVVVPLGFALDNGPHYGGDACWLRNDTHFIWAFIAPVIVTILINIGFFIMAIYIMHHHEKKKLRTSQLVTAKHWLKSCISLVLVMGITWIIGVLSFHEALLAVSYIFTIFVAFQGALIFILFVPLSKQVREQYKRWWKCKVAGSEFLSSYFGEMAEHSLSRQFTRLTTFRSATIREPKFSRNSDSRCAKNPSEFVSSHNETSIHEKEKVPLETMESVVLSEKVEEHEEEKKDLQVFLELLEDAATPTPTSGGGIPAEGWSVIWKAPSEERSQESPPKESEEQCTGL